jgi:hypothetical protein
MTKLLLGTLMLFASYLSFAQSKKDPAIFLGAILGVQKNAFAQHFIIEHTPVLYPFGVGAGSTYTKNNWLIGLGFIYASTSKQSNNASMQYIGFTNTIDIGYNLTKSNTLKCSPHIGVALSNNQLLIENIQNQKFQNIANNQWCGTLALNFKYINTSHLYTGLNIGYMFPFAGSTSWDNNNGIATTNLSDNINTIYIQLHIGGLLNLKKN